MIINRGFQNWHSQTYSLENAARTHASLGRMVQADSLFGEALRLARRLHADNRERDLYESISEAYEWNGHPAEALRFYKKFDAKRDSLFDERKNQQLAELQTRYETGQKATQIATLNLQNALNRRHLTHLGIGTALLGLLLGGLAWQYTRLRRSRERVRAQSAQLALLMMELHHRVKNNLAIVSGLLNLQTYQLDDERAVRAVREGQQRVEAMSLIHQKLYQSDAPTQINVREYLTNLAESLLCAYGYDPDGFDLDLRVEREWLDVDVAIPLGLICNELLTNAFKYAYDGVDHPVLTVWLTGQTSLTLEVADNGPGLDLTRWRQPGGSFGKQLLESLGEQLGGAWTIESQHGTRFRLLVPAHSLHAA